MLYQMLWMMSNLVASQEFVKYVIKSTSISKILLKILQLNSNLPSPILEFISEVTRFISKEVKNFPDQYY